jgi:transposase InsO family protein
MELSIDQSGYRIGRKVLYDLMRNNKLLVRRRKKYAVTTDSRHWMRKWPNLIRSFNFHCPNLLWISDITYINLNGDFACLALITDAYSHKIAGHRLSPILGDKGTVYALCMAIENTPENHQVGLTHHSDRGMQYCRKEYIKILKDNNIRIGMTENGNPYENALAERVNGILKSEWLDDIGQVNMGNPNEFIMLELAQIVIELTDSESKIVFCSLPSDDPKHRKPDIQLAKVRLNWKLEIQLQERLLKTIDCFNRLYKPIKLFQLRFL